MDHGSYTLTKYNVYQGKQPTDETVDYNRPASLGEKKNQL